MKFYRYWTRETGELLVAGAPQPVRCVAGSNVSIEDAARLARERIAAIQRRLDGDRDAFADYDPAIREEVIRVVDERNVVTRTRYGALILNSEDTMFVDIDAPPSRLWKNLFAWRGLSPRDRIVAHVEEMATRPPLAATSIRLYETRAGVRAIVLGAPVAAASRDAQRVFETLHADRLYASLCRKQQCYRARVTPKPYRVHCGGMRVTIPRDAEQQKALDAWIPRYEAACRGHATCRFIRQIGRAPSTRIVDLHDEMTAAHSDLPLA